MVRWNAYVQRPDLGLYSHPKKFWGMESDPMFTPREKSPLAEKKNLPRRGWNPRRCILPRRGWNPRRCIKQNSEPNTLPTSYSGPIDPVTPGARRHRGSSQRERRLLGCLISQQHAKCISEACLPRHLHLLPHWNKSC